MSLREAHRNVAVVREDARARIREAQLAFGTELRKERYAKGWSLRKLARRIGVSPPFISDIELGRRSPSPTVAARLCKALEDR